MAHEKKFQVVYSRQASLFEAAFISLTFVCLPTFEAPKNVFSILFLLTWLVQALRSRSLGKYCGLNWPIWGLAALLWVAPFFSEYGETITSMNSAPRWTLLALFAVLAARLNYTRPQLMMIWLALLLGGGGAVLESFWVWHGNGKEYPEFRSVGHVNHSAMYVLVVLGSGLAAIITRQKMLLLMGGVTTALMLSYLPPAKSGVALIATIAVLVSYVALLIKPRFGWKPLVFGILVMFVASVSAAALFGGGLWEEFLYRLSSSNPTNGRLQYLQIALEVFDRHPLFGTGWFSFAEATSADVLREEISMSGNVVDFGYAGHPHGHNLWTTMLVERGLLGVVLITTLLVLYFGTFLPIALSREQLDPVDRGAAVGALLVAVGFMVAGLGNTTMMNEHGHAGMAFIAVAYGYLRGRGIIHSSQRQSRP